MSRFFVPIENINKVDKVITITDSQAKHICDVLRMKVGDKIQISDGFANGYDGKIISIINKVIEVKYEASYRILSEPLYNVVLFQGLPKGDKMDFVIQKSVELGVKQIVPVQMKRSVVKLDNKKKEKKTQRWNEISRSASTQSGRGIIPEVLNPIPFNEALDIAKKCSKILVPYELERDMKTTSEVLEEIKATDTIGIFIGPEGGFELDEIEALDLIGSRITLGKRILRTETAGLAALAMLILKLEIL